MNFMHGLRIEHDNLWAFKLSWLVCLVGPLSQVIKTLDPEWPFRAFFRLLWFTFSFRNQTNRTLVLY